MVDPGAMASALAVTHDQETGSYSAAAQQQGDSGRGSGYSHPGGVQNTEQGEESGAYSREAAAQLPGSHDTAAGHDTGDFQAVTQQHGELEGTDQGVAHEQV